MKQKIQLKESQLKAMIAESVRNVLKEGGVFKSMRDTERKNLAYPHNPSEDEICHFHETDLLAIQEDLNEWESGLLGHYRSTELNEVYRLYIVAMNAINKIGETLYGWEFEN